MGLLNWGNAISEAGKSMQTMGLEGVKSVLEQDKIRLADELASKREEARDIRQEGYKVASEERAIQNAPRMQEAVFPGLEKIESMKSDILSTAKANEIKLESETRIAEFKTLDPLKRASAIATQVETLAALSTPEALKSERSIALAKHIVDPSYSITAAGDGTIRTFDTRSGKVGGQLVDPTTNEVIKVKDPQQLAAATSIVSLVNTQLRIAQADHKAELAAISSDMTLSTEDRKTRTDAANASWKTAVEQARTDAAPAAAILNVKAAGTPMPAAAPKTYSASDLATTVAKSGKSEEEVKAAYAAKGMVLK
jgi:hypothetical protein